jgi:ribosomal protein S18 acetylase RimI-like enzyme
MHITVEHAMPEDAASLVKVQMAAFHSDTDYNGVALGGPPGYDSIETLLQKLEENDYYKIVVEGQIVGGIVVFDTGEGHFHLDLIYVDPAYHHRGIGTRALQLIEQAYPAVKWTLHTPDYAIRNQHFYEKFGYVKVGEEVHPDITLFAYEKYVT